VYGTGKNSFLGKEDSMRNGKIAVGISLLCLFVMLGCLHTRLAGTARTVELTVLNVPAGC
jgi:hypothetical protein